MQDTGEEAKTNSYATFFNGPLYIDASKLAEQQGIIYISSVRTEDVVSRADVSDGL